MTGRSLKLHLDGPSVGARPRSRGRASERKPNASRRHAFGRPSAKRMHVRTALEVRPDRVYFKNG